MRRKTARLPCSSSLTASLFLPGAGKRLDIWVLDLSAKGVGVMAWEDIEVGEEVIIRLKRTPAISMIPFHARVIHCTAENECGFRIGCEFTEPIDSVLWEYLIS
jgi:PilZ domain